MARRASVAHCGRAFPQRHHTRRPCGRRTGDTRSTGQVRERWHGLFIHPGNASSDTGRWSLRSARATRAARRRIVQELRSSSLTTSRTLQSPHPKATLVDFQRPNLPFERRPRDPESGRRSRGPEHASAARAQGIFDDRLLVRSPLRQTSQAGYRPAASRTASSRRP